MAILYRTERAIVRMIYGVTRINKVCNNEKLMDML